MSFVLLECHTRNGRCYQRRQIIDLLRDNVSALEGLVTLIKFIPLILNFVTGHFQT